VRLGADRVQLPGRAERDAQNPVFGTVDLEARKLAVHMEEPNVIVERDGRVGIVLMNRPKQLNALAGDLMEAVVDALGELDADSEIRAIVLGGGERAFAAGADIGELSAATPVTLYENRRLDRWDAIRKVRTPIVAAVSGFCLGGGCELAMLCDLIVASETAKFGQPEINLGVLPGAGGTQRLTRAVGKAIAMDMILTGRMLSAREALEHGLVARVVAKEAWLDEAKRVAGEIAAKGPIAVRLAKEAVDQSFETPLAAGVELERRSFFLARASEDAGEGLKAFLEKRKPDFTGR
jgi:enoyl-CoA hydratase